MLSNSSVEEARQSEKMGLKVRPPCRSMPRFLLGVLTIEIKSINFAVENCSVYEVSAVLLRVPLKESSSAP